MKKISTKTTSVKVAPATPTSVAPSWSPLQRALSAVDRAPAVYLRELAAHMRAAGIERLELDAEVHYSFFDDGEENDGEIVAIEFENGELCGVDEDMRLRLDVRNPSEILEIAQNIVWPNGKSGVIVSGPANRGSP
jgi:hypothetical protein